MRNLEWVYSFLGILEICRDNDGEICKELVRFIFIGGIKNIG